MIFIYPRGVIDGINNRIAARIVLKMSVENDIGTIPARIST